MIRAALALLAAFGLALGAPMAVGQSFEEEIEGAPGFDVLSLSTAAQLVEERFSGKLIAARLMPPRPEEWRQNVQLVHELRLLTPERNVLLIRLDAKTGRFLEIAGSGITQARKTTGPTTGKTTGVAPKEKSK